jgi:hypothetical protein
MDSESEGGGGETPGSSYRHRQYPLDHQGPFVVFVRKIEKPINHIELSKTINALNKGVILSLVKINATKIKIVFSDRKVANNIHKALYLSDYHVYIPAVSVEINGIIFISPYSDEQELVSDGKGRFRSVNYNELNILEAFRFKRKITTADGRIEEIDSSAVRVTFEGTLLPEYVCIYGLAVPVKPHVAKVMHCTNCLNFGHTYRFCSAKSKCNKCGGPHTNESCKEIPHICVHCKENVDHSKKEDCPKYMAQKAKLIEVSKTRKAPVIKERHNFYSILSSQGNPELIPNSQNTTLFNRSGSAGPSGSTGPASPSGSSGTVGPSGSSGSASPSGSSGPAGPSGSSAPPRKRRLQDQAEVPDPQPSSSNQNNPYRVNNNISFASVAGGNNNNNPKKRRSRKRSSQNRSKTCEPGVDEPSSTPNDHDEDLAKKKALRDAIRARIVALGMNPMVLKAADFLLPPILDFFWPMISPFVSFIIPLLSQHGSCC